MCVVLCVLFCVASDSILDRSVSLAVLMWLFLSRDLVHILPGTVQRYNYYACRYVRRSTATNDHPRDAVRLSRGIDE